MLRGWGSFVLALVVALGGCLQAGLVPCGDKLCPTGHLCVGEMICASDDAIAACTGLEDGAPCTISGVGGGCSMGVCVATACGNGERDPAEACDDGNNVSGDGCRDDCGKIELCGDELLDSGEICDDGNTNAIDGCDACQRQRWVATTAVGRVQLALEAALDEPIGVAVDVFGNIYTAEPDAQRVRKIAPDGSVTVLAGTGEQGFSGDGGQAASAALRSPWDVAVDALGNVYIADVGNTRVRRVSPDGVITTIAGTSTAGNGGDGGPATGAQLQFPRSVAVDGLGNVYVVSGNRVRRIRTDGVIEPFAGTGTAGFSGDNGPATLATLRAPQGLAVDAAGNVFIADHDNNRIRKVATNGVITTVAGNAPAIGQPNGVAAAADGTLYFVQQNVALRISPDGVIHPFAGSGNPDFAGDGGPALAAGIADAADVAVAPDGAVLILDSNNNRVRRVGTDNIIHTIAGIGNEGLIGDGGDATGAQYGYPRGFTIAPGGTIYIADTDFYRVRRVQPSGDVDTIAGIGIYGYAGDGGPAVAAAVSTPEAVAADVAGSVFVADTDNNVVRKIATDGTITTVAGTGDAGNTGDDGPGTAALLNGPSALAFASNGDLLIVDRNNDRVRRLDAGGVIHAFAGTGTPGATGDGGPAIAATLDDPIKIATRGTDVFIADRGNARVRRVDGAGVISRFAGGGAELADGGLATSAQLDSAEAVAVDSTGVVYIAENGRLREVAVDGTISTLMTLGAFGWGDGGPVADAATFDVTDLAVDANDALYILDYIERRIRRVANGTITTVVGFLGIEGVGAAMQARLATPVALAAVGTQTLVASGVQGVVELIANGRVRRAIGRYPHEQATGVLAAFRAPDFGSVGGVAIDETAGVIYLTEQSANRIHAVAMMGAGIDPENPDTWTISVFANTAGTAGLADGPRTTATFREPSGLMFDPTSRTLYVVDTGNHAIRAIDVASGVVTTVVNDAGSLGFAGDGEQAANALLYRPTAIARCPNGDVFVADTGNHRVRRIATSTGLPSMPGTATITPAQVAAAAITTVVGDGVAASSGDGAPAHIFPVAAPRGLACDAENNLFVSSTTTVRALPANEHRIVDGNGPVLTIYGAYPRTTFPATQAQCLTGVLSLTPTGHSSHVQVADGCTGLLVDLMRETTAP